MARDDADTDRLKAEIPKQYQPSRDAGGLLANHFSLADSRSESAALQGSEITERERHNLGTAFIGGDASEVAPNFLLSGAQANGRGSRGTEEAFSYGNQTDRA